MMWQIIVIAASLSIVSCQTPAASDSPCQNGPITCEAYSMYRSYNGCCINFERKKWHMAVRPYNRLLPNNYADGKYAWPVTSKGKKLPSARYVSNIINPLGTYIDKNRTLGTMQFGQFVSHDCSLTGSNSQTGNQNSLECCTKAGKLGKDSKNPGCYPIYVPKNDPIYKKAGIECLSFDRTATTKNYNCTGNNKPADPMTVESGCNDLGIVYGPSEERANSLRTHKDGEMIVVERHSQTWPPQVANVTKTCPLAKSSSAPCYRAGDDRVNQNPQLTTLHIAFLRQHNVIAKKLAKINPHWDDEKIYQEARRINIAMYQDIIYTEYLPAILGEKFTLKKNLRYLEPKECVNDYNSNVDPSALVESSTVALRALHSQIYGHLKLIDEERNKVGNLRLSSYFNSPYIQEVNKTSDKCDLNYDYLCRGLSYQNSEKADKYFDAEIKHYLFRGQNKFGSDLRAIDIQRARDHGMGKYIEARKFCKLSVPKTFEDLCKFMPKKNVDAIKLIYKNVEDIELSVGGILEHHAEGSLLGPTYQCIIYTQFIRARIGDRYFYENCEPSGFTKEQLYQIHKSSFACLLCANSYCVEKIQPQAFKPIGPDNELVSCKKLCDIDFEPWRENNDQYSDEYTYPNDEDNSNEGAVTAVVGEVNL